MSSTNTLRNNTVNKLSRNKGEPSASSTSTNSSGILSSNFFI